MAPRKSATSSRKSPRRRNEKAKGSAAHRSAPPKLQRWTDLLAALLAHRFPVAFETLRRYVPAYGESKKHDTVMRMFERDKDELRAFGVPIETVPMPDGETTGYLLRHRDFYLPYLEVVASQKPAGRAKGDTSGHSAVAKLTFEPDELAAIISAAARARTLGDPLLAEDAESAMRKLAFDLPVVATATEPHEHVVHAREEAGPDVFQLLGRALMERKRVTFAYRAMGDDTVSHREVEPYGLFYLSGHWYLAGCDRGREAVRNFRLNRISELKVNAKKSQSSDYEIPKNFELREHARSKQAWELGDQDSVEAIVEFRATTGAVEAAARLGQAVSGHARQRRFTVRRSDAFARWLLSFTGEALPISPPAIVQLFHEQARNTLRHHADGV